MKKILIFIAVISTISCKKQDTNPVNNTPDPNFIYSNYYLITPQSSAMLDTIHFINGKVHQLVSSSYGYFGDIPYTTANGEISIPAKWNSANTNYIHTYNSGQPNKIDGKYIHLSIAITSSNSSPVWSNYGITYMAY